MKSIKKFFGIGSKPKKSGKPTKKKEYPKGLNFRKAPKYFCYMNGQGCNEEELYFQIIRDLETGSASNVDFDTEFNLGDSAEMMEQDDLMTKQEWVDQINTWYSDGKLLSYNQKKSRNLLESVVNDYAPLEIRGHIWMVLSGGFLHLHGMPQEGDFDFAEIINHEEGGDFESTIEQIQKDVDRTYFPKEEHMQRYEPHIYKRSEIVENTFRENIREVLKAYSLIDSEIGYVQGMSSIVAAIEYNLFVAKWAFEKVSFGKRYKLKMNLEFSRRDTFCIFYGIMTYLRLREFNRKGMDILTTSIEGFGKKLKLFDREVYDELTDNNVTQCSFIGSSDRIFCCVLSYNLSPCHSSSSICKNYRYLLAC